ncbi:MAG: trypsin-like serine peptidase [Kofleriaceae bacterium]
MAAGRSWRLAFALAGTVLACDHCNPPPPAVGPCSECDPYFALRDEGVLDEGTLAALPAAADYCADKKPQRSATQRWTALNCWENTAHSITSDLGWGDDLEAEWEELADHCTSVCPCSGTGGCSGAPADDTAAIVQEVDIKPMAPLHPGVALFVPGAELDAPSLDALMHPLSEGIDEFTSVFPDGQLECTAFLIHEAFALTARHCVPKHLDACKGTLPAPIHDWVLAFDYGAAPGDALRVENLSLMACGSGVNADYNRGDWALLRLEDPQPSRMLVALDAEPAMPSACDPVYVIGHPLGHPQAEIGTDDAARPTTWIREFVPDSQDRPAVFSFNVDAIDGLSGAPVFDLDGHAVGLHIRGGFRIVAGQTLQCSSVDGDPTCLYGKAIALAEIADEVRDAMAD